MQANYAQIARRSAVTAALVAAVMVGLSAALGGERGLLGGLIAVVLVALFFGISVVAVGRAARVSPQAMMATAVGVYLGKILVLLILIGQFQNSTAFNGRFFGATAIVCVLAYNAGLIVWSMRLKVPYIEPAGER